MNKIPKIIHYCWVGGTEKPESVKYCISSWKKFCPDYEIVEWNETNYDFTQNQYMKEAYDAKKWGFVPDYARLDIIYRYGGFYLDTDVEIIKSFDDLLDNESVFGFEDTGENEFFVSCGLGFGAKPQNPLIKKLLNCYDNLKFKLSENSYDLTPAPRINTPIFQQNNFIMNNKYQSLNGNCIFPSEYFCPKIFKTGKTKITENTHSIHHFTASWMDDNIKKEIDHNSKIINIFGDKIGKLILLIESIANKYNLKSLLVKMHDTFLLFFPLIKSILLRGLKKNNEANDLVLLDTSLYSKNAGDAIIMENCLFQLSKVINTTNLKHISTHIDPVETNCLRNTYKILCGTNVLSNCMEKYGLWKMPKNLNDFNNIILFGVGYDRYGQRPTLYTKLLLKYLLASNKLHSVRDSYSLEALSSIGINNVLYTGCPTMWRLTPEHCSNIPRKKSSNVMSTITDYNRNLDLDKTMLDILINSYEKVYLWLQGSEDLSYLQEIGYENKVICVKSKLECYDNILLSGDIDYVGTRLHAGIRALSYGIRSIIISVDNRAESISKDTNLPIIYRNDIPEKLESKIFSEFETIINLPWDNINHWLSQFSK